MAMPEQASGASAAVCLGMPADPEAARPDARADAEPGARGAKGAAPAAPPELADVLGAGAATLLAAGAVMWLVVFAWWAEVAAKWPGITFTGVPIAQGALGMLSSASALAACGLWRANYRGAWGAGRVGLGGLLAVKLVVEVSLWVALVAKVQALQGKLPQIPVAAILAPGVACDTTATLLAAVADGLMLYVVFTAPSAPLAAPTAEQWRDLLGCGAASLQAAMAVVWHGTSGAWAPSRGGYALVAQGFFGALLSAAAAGGYGLWRVDFRDARATLRASIIGLLAVKLFAEVVFFIAVEVVVTGEGEAWTAGNTAGNVFESLLAVGADLLMLHVVATAAAGAKA